MCLHHDFVCLLACCARKKKTTFCAGCCEKPEKESRDGDRDGDSEKSGSPLRLLRGCPALVQAICAFCLPTIRDSDGDYDDDDENEDDDNGTDSESDDDDEHE